MKSITLIFVEGENDFEILKNDFEKSQNTKIVSFDYKSHNLLSKANIQHFLMEDYITKDDEAKIDSLSVEFTQNWHKVTEISKLLEYKKMNIGELVENEMIPFFFHVIKRIFGIKRVIEKEKPEQIISSSLNKIIEYYYKEEIKITKRSKKETVSSLYYDNIEIPINFGSKTKSIRISRKTYSKLKKIIENFTNLFFRLKYDNKDAKKSILFLDFNPVMYSDLIKELSLREQKFIFLNQRRPVIWNYESLKIIKNSRCKIASLDHYIEPSILTKITDETAKLKNKINNLWAKNSILEKIFSIDEISFWEIIKNNFKNMIDERGTEVVKRSILLERFFELSKISVIVEWADTAFEEKIVVHIAKKYEIPILLLQHGTTPLNQKWKKYHHLVPYFPPKGVKSLTWGEPMKEFILKNGFSDSDVISIGSPRHDRFFNRKNIVKNNGTVLVAANGFMQYNFAGNDSRSYDYLDEYTKKICKIIKKISDRKIIVKLHPGQFYYDIKPTINEIDPSISILQNQDIVNLIESCDIMISLNYSTAALDAMILQKPTLTVLPEKQGYEKEEMITMGATLYEPDLSKIEIVLKELLENEEFREKIILRGNNFVRHYLVNPGKSSEEIAQFLTKF